MPLHGGNDQEKQKQRWCSRVSMDDLLFVDQTPWTVIEYKPAEKRRQGRDERLQTLRTR